MVRNPFVIVQVLCFSAIFIYSQNRTLKTPPRSGADPDWNAHYDSVEAVPR